MKVAPTSPRNTNQYWQAGLTAIEASTAWAGFRGSVANGDRLTRSKQRAPRTRTRPDILLADAVDGDAPMFNANMSPRVLRGHSRGRQRPLDGDDRVGTGYQDRGAMCTGAFSELDERGVPVGSSDSSRNGGARWLPSAGIPLVPPPVADYRRRLSGASSVHARIPSTRTASSSV